MESIRIVLKHRSKIYLQYPTLNMYYIVTGSSTSKYIDSIAVLCKGYAQGMVLKGLLHIVEVIFLARSPDT